MPKYIQHSKKELLEFLEENVIFFEGTLEKYKKSLIEYPDEKFFYEGLIKSTLDYIEEQNRKIKKLKSEVQNEIS